MKKFAARAATVLVAVGLMVPGAATAATGKTHHTKKHHPGSVGGRFRAPDQHVKKHHAKKHHPGGVGRASL